MHGRCERPSEKARLLTYKATVAKVEHPNPLNYTNGLTPFTSSWRVLYGVTISARGGVVEIAPNVKRLSLVANAQASD